MTQEPAVPVREVKPAIVPASANLRLCNLIIDLAVALGFLVVLARLLPGLTDWPALLLFVSWFLLYYILLECRYQKTLGKLITHTRVVTVNGTRPALGSIIVRTLLRCLPYEPAIGLFTGDWSHDCLSGTQVIIDRKQRPSSKTNC